MKHGTGRKDADQGARCAPFGLSGGLLGESIRQAEGLLSGSWRIYRGGLATPVFQLAKRSGKPAEACAQALAETVDLTGTWFVKAVPVGGYLNLTFAPAWYDAAAKTWKEGKKYLQVSTDEVYGALGAEGYFMETTPLCPHSPYSASKASADMFVKAFHDTYGMPINITRCSNNYGPYQFPEKLIPLLINNAKHHKTLPVYGDGMQIRDWLYVMDHCKAIDMVANGGKDGEVYNVGGHNERPNIFIVKTVIEQLHDRLKDEGISEELIKHVADRLGHDRRYGIDPTKIKNDLGWYPETPFEKGIVLTIDWYLNHEEWMNHVTSGDYQNYYQDMYKNK